MAFIGEIGKWESFAIEPEGGGHFESLNKHLLIRRQGSKASSAMRFNFLSEYLLEPVCEAEF